MILLLLFLALTPKQSADLVTALRPAPLRPLEVLIAPGYSDQITPALTAAGWKIAKPNFNIEDEAKRRGVVVVVQDVKQPDAARLMKAFTTVGVPFSVIVWTDMPKGRFMLYVGPE